MWPTWSKSSYKSVWIESNSKYTPIQIISCVFHSSFLIDFDGNVWSFGDNRNRVLGHRDNTTDIIVPTKSEYLKDTQQVSYGCCGKHFFAKNSQNKIFVTECTGFRQPGIDLVDAVPQEMSRDFKVWGIQKSKAKSARK